MDDDWDLDDGWDDGIEFFPDDDPSSPDEGPGEWLRELGACRTCGLVPGRWSRDAQGGEEGRPECVPA